MNSILDLQRAIASALNQIPRLKQRGLLPLELDPLLRIAPPPDWGATVSLRHCGEKPRQIRSDASEGSWIPGACGVWIEYRPSEAEADGSAVHDGSSTYADRSI